MILYCKYKEFFISNPIKNTAILQKYFLLPMELHRPVLNAIITALHNVINKKLYSDKVLEHLFRENKKLGKRDRTLIAETVYNIIRYYYYYQYIANTDDVSKITDTYFKGKNKKPDANIPDRIKLSYNNDLWNEGIKQLGKDRWLREASVLNDSAHLVIRTNTLKITREELKQKLKSIGTESIESQEVPEALIIKNKKFLNQNDLFKMGYYEFQDISSQKVVHFIPREILQNAKRIIDACAGAGGKSLHLSSMMNNKGQIIAMDIHKKKIEELRKRAARTTCNNIQTKIITSSKIIKRLEHSADLLLIDTPCSGTGVIRRNPDIKIKFTSKNIQELILLQRQLLDKYSVMLKNNSCLMYVTCSIFPEENEKQIDWFLNTYSNFEMIQQQTIYPSEGFDGFYMALLKKN